MNDIIWYILLSGWILGIVLSLVAMGNSLYRRDKISFESSVLLLVLSILIGYILTYPILISMILILIFDKETKS